MSIQQDFAMIAAKYAETPAPDNYPLYGDTIEFTDELSGIRYSGIVIIHKIKATGPQAESWVVSVNECITTGIKSDDTTTMFVKFGEINKITRKI